MREEARRWRRALRIERRVALRALDREYRRRELTRGRCGECNAPMAHVGTRSTKRYCSTACPVCATALTAKSYVEINKPVYDPATKQRTLVRMRRPVRHCPTCKRTEQEFHQRGKHRDLFKSKDLIEQMKAHVPEAHRRY